ncbi:MAG TPA: alpha-amylase family glycosyl hydrolase, partial [Spirochaetota bacterium]|nr:alpha-amylase family glycosyl hydrolase [Spirochaetota bacterium]
GNGQDMFNMCFDFPLVNQIRNAVYAGEKSTSKVKELNNYINDQINTYPEGYRNATFLNNHDNVVSRPMTDYDKNEAKAILAFALNTLLPGTPFVYFGNELGMENGKGQGDLRFRTDMEWVKYESMNKNKDSILSWYRYLIDLRNNSLAIKRGDYKDITTSDSKILAFTRSYQNETKLIVINFKNSISDVYLDFSGKNIKESELTLVIGSLYNGDKNIIGNKYKQFLVEKMPAFSFRVYSTDTKNGLIAKDYLNNN